MVVKNCRIKFGSVTQADKFNEDKITVRFFVDDENEEQKLLEAIDKAAGGKKFEHMGHKVYKNAEDSDDADNGRNLFTAWTYAKDYGTDKDHIVPVYDKNGVKYPDDERPNLSWGSIVNLSVTPKLWKTKKDTGVKIMLNKLQEVEPIYYEGDDIFGAVDGFDGNDEKQDKNKKKEKKKKEKKK